MGSPRLRKILGGIGLKAMFVATLIWPTPSLAADPTANRTLETGSSKAVETHPLAHNPEPRPDKPDKGGAEKNETLFEEAPSLSPSCQSIRVLGEGVDWMDPQAARQRAKQNALKKLYEQLNVWAEELTGQSLSARQLVAEHAWLLAQPGVQHHQQMSVEEKSKTSLSGEESYLKAQQEMTLVVPTEVLARWAERLQDQKSQHMVWVAGTITATVLAWLLGLVLTMKLDRATGAYYRRSLLLVMVLILGILTGVGWWLVWRMM